MWLTFMRVLSYVLRIENCKKSTRVLVNYYETRKFPAFTKIHSILGEIY